MYKKITFIILSLISIVATSQTVTTVTNGNFQDGLGQDSEGNIYGSHWAGNTVYKYDTSGNVSVFKNGFTNPNGIAVNSADEIYICDHGGNTVYKYDKDGNLLDTYGNLLFTTPAGIKRIPGTDDMLVVEYGTVYTAATTITNSKIKKIAADGTVTTLLDAGLPLNGPAGIAYINDVAYIANYNDRKIFRFEGGALTEIAQLPATAAASNVVGFMSAINNELIATQIGENKIYKINPTTGAITLYAGSTEGNADGDLNTATFNLPNGILGDDANNRIYISEGATNNLRIINNAVLSTNTFVVSKFEVNVFPNPTKDSLNIKLTNLQSSSITLKVYNSMGKEILKREFYAINGDLKSEIKTSNWSRGTYILKIKDGNEIISKKIIL